MKFKKSLSFFIPAYNEEGNILEISEEIVKFLKNNFSDYEYLIVVNKSTDKTLELSKNFAKNEKNVRVIEQKDFVGYGTQLKTGWENSRKSLIFYTDSDRQFKIDELKNFMDYIEDYDVVVGYRVKRRDPTMRIIYSKIYNLTLKLLLGIRVKDVDCAFKLCKREVIDSIKPLNQDRGSDAEFLVKATAKGYKIKEIPVTHKPRIVGVSEAESNSSSFFVKIKPEIILALIKETLKLRKYRK